MGKKRINKYIFHSGTIFTQLVIFTMVVSAAPVLFISFLLFQKIGSMVTEELAVSHNQMVAQYTTTLEGRFDQYQKSLKQISNNTIVLTTLQGKSGVSNPYVMGNQISVEVNKSLHLDGKEIRNCMVYSNNLENKVYGTRVAMMEDASREAWYSKMNGIDQGYFINDMGDDKKNSIFSLIETIIYIDLAGYKRVNLGVIKLDLYTEALFKPVEAGDHTYAYHVIALDQENHIVYSSDINYNDIIKDRSFEDISQNVSYYKDTVVYTDTENNNGLKLIFLFDNNQLGRKKQEIEKTVLPILFLVMVTIGVAAFLFTRSFSARVSKLIEKIKVAETGDLTITEEIKGNDEIAILDKQFSQMLLKLDRLIKKNYIQQLENKESEFKNLQLQINPHFLYNTLETISSIAAVNNVFIICNLCEKLGENFRYSLGKNYGEFVTVTQELFHTQNYVYIQKTRFKNRFEVYYSMEEGIEDHLIPRFILQPIVENAIVHGLSTNTRKGTLEISIYKEEDMLFLKIEDDGIGMTVEKLEEIREYIDNKWSADKKKKSIGIQNVNQRIKLTYGEQYGITIESEEYKGSCFTIKVPFMRQEVSDGKEKNVTDSR